LGTGRKKRQGGEGKGKKKRVKPCSGENTRASTQQKKEEGGGKKKEYRQEKTPAKRIPPKRKIALSAKRAPQKYIDPSTVHQRIQNKDGCKGKNQNNRSGKRREGGGAHENSLKTGPVGGTRADWQYIEDADHPRGAERKVGMPMNWKG